MSAANGWAKCGGPTMCCGDDFFVQIPDHAAFNVLTGEPSGAGFLFSGRLRYTGQSDKDLAAGEAAS